MFTKIALAATCALAVVSGQDDYSNTWDKIASRRPYIDTTPYGSDLLGEILIKLNITHVDSDPLEDDEYNNAVDIIKGLLIGEYQISNPKTFKSEVSDVLARLTPEDFEQLTDDVFTELMRTFVKSTFGLGGTDDTEDSVTEAPTTAAPMTPMKKKAHRRGATWGV
ncbi:Aste57867_21341 [Aphanomyces stellatus]|uniref:Aste57867_21341 protein n=1 Tax=Aphanomyces stellatus TaxID=120398 RepID=A0A485LHB3_9STRA|nr:hypothetical protein As57867_021272 [Aphanomyces stellatus]VFT98013.1 Aste57867_21341 [Aphanomyces stellatus]